MANVTAKRRLVLHFDVNNSILMNDKSKGLNTADNVSRIVAKSAWGRHSIRDDGSHAWELAHDQLTFCQPEECNLWANLQEHAGKASVACYADYLDVILPALKGEETQEEKEERNEQRRTALAKFSQAGGLGSKFKNTCEKLMKNLSLPKGAKEELGITGDQGMEPEQNESVPKSSNEDESEDEEARKERELKAFEKRMLRELYGEGRYHLIPSFFRTLMYLKKQKQEFAVVFRTFGQDLKNVTHEFDKFARGEHPCFNGRNGMPVVKMDGAKATKDFRIRNPDEQIAHLYRCGSDISETVMVQGKDHTRVPNDQLNFVDSDDNIITRDPIEIYQTMLEVLKKHSVMGIQDDFPSYNANGRENDQAKLMLIDQADYNTQHIFFDDNADSAESCIVDVRDLVTGEALPYKKYMDMYVVKVHPHKAILESDYFVKQIELCEAKRDEEIRRMEAGIAEEEYEQLAKKLDTETEWEKMQKLADAEYLMKTVLPVLYMGMRTVDLERPNAPLEYLAMYLLKNQDKVSLPPKILSKVEEPAEESAKPEAQPAQQEE